VVVSYLNVRCSSVWLEEARKVVGVVVDGRLLYFEEVRTRHFRMICRITAAVRCLQCEGKMR
jgi:hypothetical protein